MSELRQVIADTIREHVFGDDTPTDEAECCADAVMRVLAEHGGVKNLREQISLMVWRSANERAERVAADLAAARQQLDQVREGIVQAIIQDASSRPQAAEPFRRGMFTAADIAREYAKEPREEGR
jgi:hypothetical protein